MKESRTRTYANSGHGGTAWRVSRMHIYKCVTNLYMNELHKLVHSQIVDTNSYARRLWTQVWPNVCHECLCMNDSRTHTNTQIVDTEAWLDTPPAGTTFYMIVRDIFISLILWVRDTFVCEMWGRDSIDWFRNPISRTNWDVHDIDLLSWDLYIIFGTSLR